MTDYLTKDSGAREQFDSGMVRDTQAGKPRFDLIIPLGLPYDEQMLTRLAKLMARGADKYGDRNWEKAEGTEELDRARASAFRHFMQWLTGEHDEDHAAAAWFNMTEAELIEWKLANKAGVPAEGVEDDALSDEPIDLWPTGKDAQPLDITGLEMDITFDGMAYPNAFALLRAYERRRPTTSTEAA